MEALILAGGLGKRLQSVVADRPKPMADIAGRPFLEYQLDVLSAQGVRRVVLAVGYKHELIQSHFGSAHRGMELFYSIEHEPLGTGGCIMLALPLITDSDFFILNGDTFFDCPLARLMAAHHGNTADLTIALKPMIDCARYGTVEVAPDGRLRAWREKRPGASGLINAGIYVARREYLAALTMPDVFSLERDVMERQTSLARFFGSICDGYFIDIGVPEDYERACAELPARAG